MFSRWSFFIVSAIGATACESTGTGVKVNAPAASVSCATAKCSVSGFRDAYVVLSLSGCAEDQIGFDTVASASEQILCSGGACSGSISDWSPTQIESRSYYVCGWIDIDNNGVKGAADAFSEDYTYITGSTLSLTNWSVSYFISRKRH